MAEYVSLIDDILQAEDIEGLLDLGSPRDEYLHEAELIHSGLQAFGPNHLTQPHLRALIADVWKRSFNLSSEEIEKRLPAFERVARQIRQACLQSV